MYRRRQPGPLAAWQGAKMGAFIGLASFAFFAVFFAVDVGMDPAAYRQNIDQAVQKAVASNPDPQVQQMLHSLLTGTRGTVVFTAILMVFSLGFLAAIGGISGSLAAVFFRKKSDKSSL
jgi:hypothetical protein